MLGSNHALAELIAGMHQEIGLLLEGKYRVRFVIRWVKNHLFLTTTGEEKKLWQIGQGKKYLAHKEIRDPMTGEKMPCDLWWSALRHPSSGEILYLVRARVKKGIMYLIPNDPVRTEEQAWEVFFTRASGVGRSNPIFATTNANLLSNARAYGH